MAGSSNEQAAAALPEEDTNCQKSSSQLTFTFTGEDHTLGNALRSILVRKPGVQFAGYSVPHPNQPEMNIRLQTTGESAMELLHECLQDLTNVCDYLDLIYDEALDEYYEKRRTGVKSASSTT